MTVAFVIPCYNEEEALPLTAVALGKKVAALKSDTRLSSIAEYRIYFVDDGSTDKTWAVIQSLNQQDKMFCGIKLAGNRGHQNALLAGLLTTKTGRTQSFPWMPTCRMTLMPWTKCFLNIKTSRQTLCSVSAPQGKPIHCSKRRRPRAFTSSCVFFRQSKKHHLQPCRLSTYEPPGS